MKPYQYFDNSGRPEIYDSVMNRWPLIRVIRQRTYDHKENIWREQEVKVKRGMPVRSMRNWLIHEYNFDPTFDIGFYDDNDGYLGMS